MRGAHRGGRHRVLPQLREGALPAVHSRSARRALLRGLSCADCSPVLPRRLSQNRRQPGLAATLGFIPGLGAVYNGEYVKALIHVLIFGGSSRCSAANSRFGYDAFFESLSAAFIFTCPLKPTARPRPAAGRARARRI